MGRQSSKMWLGLAVLLALVVATPAAWGDVRVGVGVVVDDVSLGEALLIGAIGSFFGLDTKVVATYHHRQRLCFSHIVLMMYLARRAGCDHHHVAALRSRGHGWGRIAKDLGIHPGTFNKMRKGLAPGRGGDKAFEESALIWFLATYHGASHNDVRRYKDRGHSLPDIFIALDFSSKSGKGPGDLLAHRNRAKSWHRVANAVGLSSPCLKQPAKPKGGQAFRGSSGKPGKPASNSVAAAPTQDKAPKGQGAQRGGKGKGRNK